MRKRINYIAFEKRLLPFKVFSLSDVLKIYPQFDSRRLTEWQQKGYISKLIKGCYIFNETKIDEEVLFLIANKLLRPSYVSLESALSQYGMIPEQVFSITSVTTQKTNVFETVEGHFNYRSIKENLFFGYRVLHRKNLQPVLIAEPEKALLDFLYFNPRLHEETTLTALRLNKATLCELDTNKIAIYLKLFNNTALTHRYQVLKETYLCLA